MSLKCESRQLQRSCTAGRNRNASASSAAVNRGAVSAPRRHGWLPVVPGVGRTHAVTLVAGVEASSAWGPREAFLVTRPKADSRFYPLIRCTATIAVLVGQSLIRRAHLELCGIRKSSCCRMPIPIAPPRFRNAEARCRVNPGTRRSSSRFMSKIDTAISGRS
jgi:hypothetical protein